MDKQTAKSKLKELRDSLSEVLDGKEYQSADEIKEQSKEAIQQARSASKQLKKSLLEKIKDLPVVQKVSELGTAGSVAVSTAAVAQTTVAIDQTEVFVASVANDVVEERFEIPGFIDNFIDFHELNDWGQVVLIEKVSEAQAFVSEVSEQRQIPIQSSDQQDSKSASSASSASSQGVSDASSSQNTQPEETDKSSETQNQEQESKEESSSEENNESKSGSESNKKDKQQQTQERQTEAVQESQENNSSSEPSTNSEDVKDLPIIETPFESDPAVRQVSPTI